MSVPLAACEFTTPTGATDIPLAAVDGTLSGYSNDGTKTTLTHGSSNTLLADGCGNEGYMLATDGGTVAAYQPTNNVVLSCSNGVLTATSTGSGTQSDVDKLGCSGKRSQK